MKYTVTGLLLTSVRKEDKKTCCICGKEFEGWGNDPWPVVTDEDAVCCDNCDMTVVLSARVNEMQMQHKQSN